MRIKKLFLLVLCLPFFLNTASANKQLTDSNKHAHEAYSRYGNPSSYAVAGKKYQVLQSAQGFKQKGIASWYGKPFHNQSTSSGEKYNMFELTAAHKTLPLPTYVKVKNLANGREIIVRVNDRGPFKKDRIIDLSYAAAKKLGFILRGTASVEIESLDIDRKKAQYVVQAASYRLKKNADLFQQKLSKQVNFPVFVDHFQTAYSVKIGPFSTLSELEKAREKLIKLGVTEVIIKLS